jgi:hypothetical protein
VLRIGERPDQRVLQAVEQTAQFPETGWKPRCYALRVRGLVVLVGLWACRPSSQPTPNLIDGGPTAASCPPLAARGAGYPPWDVRQRRDECVRTASGRWTVRRDPSDGDGWRHFLRFEGSDGREWELVVTSPTGLAVRGDGSLVLLDLKDHVTLIAKSGAILAREKLPDCGAVERIAVAWDDTFSFTCGYSILRVDRTGRLLWQKWPFGDHHIRGPWVDQDGTIYVTGNGRVAALAPDGTPRWEVETGWNRHVGDLGWLPGGNIVFVTYQDERHTPTSAEGVRRYYAHEPPEVFEITRRGAIVSSAPLPDAGPTGGWPQVLPVAEDGAHRVHEP